MLLQELKKDVDLESSGARGQKLADIRAQVSKDRGTTDRTDALPWSPLMDPRLVSARRRHRTPKPLPSKHSPAQQKLRKNPYAQALATPVRNCFVTGIRLPDYFHLDSGLTPHPKTGVPWHLPQNLATSCDDIEINGSSDEGTASTATNAVALTATTNLSLRSANISLSGAHILAQRRCLALVSAMKAREYLGLLPRSWKEDFRVDAKSIVWREDMDTLVLEILRKKVIDQLRWLMLKGSVYIVRCYGGSEGIGAFNQAAAALWLGQKRGTDEGANTEEGACFSEMSTAESERETERTQTTQPPPPYAMLDYKGRHIPVYNLRTLLGEEHVLHLRNSSETFRGEMVVIKHKNTTTNAQMWLWKLMGYLAEDADG